MNRDNHNCHEYCRFRNICACKGENGFDPNECSMYYKFDDMMSDAKDIEEELRRSMGLEDVNDWRDYI